MPDVQIMTARAVLDSGEAVAQIERVTIGGGTQLVTVDGVAEERVHPTFQRWHVRLLSPDRMIPDELREAETYEEACEVAVKYAIKREEYAARVADLAGDLRV
jgi:hypothetical protein